jgi:spermidine synthase
MRPWELIDCESVPEDDGVLSLMSRGREFSIIVDDRELMASRMHGSEDALADLACDRLTSLEDARVLVGGLGMGFTLAAVLRRLGEAGHATVAELIPAVVRWNREYVGHVARHPLRDPRVVVHAGDVCDLVDDPAASWSAILLDIDNGPMALTRMTNGWLYTRQGLRMAHAALVPGGVLGVWSALPDPAFTRRLRRAGFVVEVLRHTQEGRPSPDGSGTHVLWMARRA